MTEDEISLPNSGSCPPSTEDTNASPANRLFGSGSLTARVAGFLNGSRNLDVYVIASDASMQAIF